MLTAQDGRSDYVKVLDFGIARIADEAAVTKFKDGAPGTLEFMAPELFATHNAPDPAIDQYALGILLYDILTGSPPFMGNDMEIVHAHLRTPPPRLSALRDPHDPVIPEALEDLAAALIAKDPKQRPTGAQTVARLMGLRPQLPPRSLRGVLALRTQVLAASQVGQALQAAQTFVLPYNRPDFAQTAQLQSVLRQLDEVEDQIARLGEQLVQRSEVLHKKRWPSGLPDVLTQIQQQIHALEQQEEELGLQLALLREEAALQERREQGRRDDLFRRLLAQREIAHARPASTPEEKRIQEEAVLALERAYHQPAVLTEAAHKLAAEQAKWQSQREELSSLRRQLAGQTLRCFLLDLRSRGAAEPGQQVAYEALEQALQTFDEQSAAVTVLCAQLPRNG